MKDLTFMDHRHNVVYVVKNPKSRKDAFKLLSEKLVPSVFYEIENMDEYVIEVDRVTTFWRKHNVRS